jgi:PiT family inorganic phosphate transporter
MLPHRDAGDKMDIHLLLVIVGLLLAFITAINIGGNDAANPTCAPVGAGVLSIKQALVIFSLFTIIGASLQGYMVMKTIGSGIVPSIDAVGAISIIICANIWILFSTLRGMAISTGHAIVSAVIGYGIATYGLNGLNSSILGTIGFSWVISPFCALVVAVGFFKLLRLIAARYPGDPLHFEKYMKALLIISLCFAAYSFGANDVSHATGVFFKIAGEVANVSEYAAMILLSIYGAMGLVIGGMTIGKNVIATLAYKVTRLDIPTALAASLSNAIVVYLFATLPYLLIGYGLPISSSYASVGAIIGAGLANNTRAVSKRSIFKLVSFWILTVPINILLCVAIFSLFNYIL